MLGGAEAWFTTRDGGVSAPPYDSLNLAGHVGDVPARVTENRRRAAAAAGRPDARWLQPHHVHGARVLPVDGRTDPGAVATTEADGTVTTDADVLLVAIGADCAPIALANDTAVAAVHSGWRGAVAGIVRAGVDALRAQGTGPVRAVVGPCICVAHYEFGADALAPLRDRWGDGVVGRTTEGRPALELRAAIRAELAGAGADEIEILDRCTAGSTDLFSYRRDGVTGRQGVVVARR